MIWGITHVKFHQLERKKQMLDVHQGDLIFIDAEPHAGHEIGGHDLEKNNIRRPFLVMSRSSYSNKSGLVIGLAITHVHRESPFRFSIVDFESQINGDALLLQLLSYDFLARHGEVVGHIHSQRQFKSILDQVRNVFEEEN